MWEELYERHQAELVRLARGLTGSQETAEDLTQETFLRALGHQGDLEELGPQQRRAWLYRTLRNLALDGFRRKKLEDGFLQSLREEEAGFSGTVELRQLISMLPDQERALFLLRYQEGYSAQELSEIFHEPAGSIRSRLSRTRRKLKTMLTE